MASNNPMIFFRDTEDHMFMSQLKLRPFVYGQRVWMAGASIALLAPANAHDRMRRKAPHRSEFGEILSGVTAARVLADSNTEVTHMDVVDQRDHAVLHAVDFGSFVIQRDFWVAVHACHGEVEWRGTFAWEAVYATRHGAVVAVVSPVLITRGSA